MQAPSLGGIGGLLMATSAFPSDIMVQHPHFDAQGNLNGITSGGPTSNISGGPFLSRTYDAYGNTTGEGTGGGLGIPAAKAKNTADTQRCSSGLCSAFVT